MKILYLNNGTMQIDSVESLNSFREYCKLIKHDPWDHLSGHALKYTELHNFFNWPAVEVEDGELFSKIWTCSKETIKVIEEFNKLYD